MACGCYSSFRTQGVTTLRGHESDGNFDPILSGERSAMIAAVQLMIQVSR